MNGHRQLVIWQLAGDLIDSAHALAAQLPARERYVADPQLRRAAWSVQNNIAEGNAKLGRGEYRRFLDTALGSLAEVDSMVARLSSMYGLDAAMLNKIELYRRQITAGIFAVLKRARI